MNPRPPGYEPGELPDCSTPRRCSADSCRAGNGTRTRDPNLGKVVLYQLSYSRMSGQDSSAAAKSPQRPRDPFRRLSVESGGHGGEGDRTPDLVNAIHALSQLSYAPVILARPRPGAAAARQASPRSEGCQADLQWRAAPARGRHEEPWQERNPSDPGPAANPRSHAPQSVPRMRPRRSIPSATT